MPRSLANGFWVFLACLATASATVAEESGVPAGDPFRVLPPVDARPFYVRKLADTNHPWIPAKDSVSWERRRDWVRKQILVANGLWPMPPKTPLNPVIHGKIDKGDYTIEKAFFQSYPGHYVSGNLYRPKNKEGKLPAVLNPHGHWKNGRFYDAGEKEAEDQMKQEAEKFPTNSRYPLQARMAGLARLGCVVFHYDMVGFADSKPLDHSAGFSDAEAQLRLQSIMGLQTWNTIRALDFLSGLEDVDPSRIGVTGASGGGTQTFILAAIDDRPAVFFPAVMVSADMQGGCVCENCPLLRVGTGNIEFAALAAPKPYGMVAADDWTRDIEKKGLPELTSHWIMLGKPENLMAKANLQFKHNYNQVSRELMYAWMDKHLGLKQASVAERPIEPVDPKELSVYDEAHPLPKDALKAEDLRKTLTAMSDKLMAEIEPKDKASFDRYRNLVGSALKAMIVDEAATGDEIMTHDQGSHNVDGVQVDRLLIGRKQPSPLFAQEAIPTIVLLPANWNGGRLVVWIHSAGHAGLIDEKTRRPIEPVKRLLEKAIAVLSPDVYLTGEFHPAGGKVAPIALESNYPGYTLCYNRSTLANRVHDILTAVGCAKSKYRASRVDLVGFGAAGPWVGLARPIAGEQVAKAAVDLNGFSFSSVKKADDVMLLPGGLKYGDIGGLVATAAPSEMYLLNGGDVQAAKIEAAYAAAGSAGSLRVAKTPADEPGQQAAMDWLLQ